MWGWLAGAAATALLALPVGVAATLLLALPAGVAARPRPHSLPAPASVWSQAGYVRAPGGPYLTDSVGRRLLLHGVDMTDKCGGGAVLARVVGTPCVGGARRAQLGFVLSPTARDPGRRFTAADAATLARLGFNFVRLGLIWEGLEPGPRNVHPNDPRYCSAHASGTSFPDLARGDPYSPTAVRAYLARTDRIVKLLARAGLRVVLDMHQDVYSSVFNNPRSPTPWNGEGAPAWAVCTGSARFAAPLQWGPGYIDPAVKVAIHHFFANDVSGDLQGQFDRVWSAVARHYRGDRDVIGYELYNEPEDFSIPTFDPELQCFYGGPDHEPSSCAQSGAQAPPGGAIGAIESVDRRHPVVYEPSVYTDYNHPESIGITEPLRFPRLVLAFHAYSAEQSSLMRELIAERDQTHTEQPGGPPLLMDEFGGSRHAASAAGTADLADGYELSWSYWSALELHDPTGNPREGLINQRTRRPYADKARALAIAYPAATAGTPGPWAFSRASGRLTYGYQVAPGVRSPSEIELPRWVYPRGYRVRARGARVLSRPGATVLELRADRRARLVLVKVYRRR